MKPDNKLFNSGKNTKLIINQSRSISDKDGTEKTVISTSDGEIQCILHPAKGYCGVIWLCGALGGLDGPSYGIFATLSHDLMSHQISSLRLNYRNPGDFESCVLDVLAGIDYMEERGIQHIALAGHSFGGAVAIMAGTMSPKVRAVAGLSSQTYGARRVDALSPVPLLLIHGDRDRNLPVHCSYQIYEWAKQPKELVIYKNNGHFLRECHKELRELVKNWLIQKLCAGRPHSEN